ncbi:hypothetical protein WN943_018862 [Citrus x changshan-huyou]
MDDGNLLENVVENADNLGNQNLVGANDAPMATTNIIGPSAAAHASDEYSTTSTSPHKRLSSSFSTNIDFEGESIRV